MSCAPILGFSPPYDEHLERGRRFSEAAAAAGSGGLSAAIAAMNWSAYVAAQHTDVAGFSAEIWRSLKEPVVSFTDFRNPPATICYPCAEGSLYSQLPLYQTFFDYYNFPSPGTDLEVSSSNNLTVTAAPTGKFRTQRVLFSGWFGARMREKPGWSAVAAVFYEPWEAIIPYSSIQ